MGTIASGEEWRSVTIGENSGIAKETHKMLSTVRRAFTRSARPVLRRCSEGVVCRPYHATPQSSFPRVKDVDVFHEDTPDVVIEGYSSNGFEINGVTNLGAQIIFPDLLLLWDVETIDDITPSTLTSVIHASPKVDLLLLGTGKTTKPVDPALVARLNECGVTVDVMATAHACQTFNVLNQEGRRVAAALLPMERTERIECIAATFS